MKQIFLAIILIAAPVAVFFAGNSYFAPHPAEAAASSSQTLGDLSALKSIINDVDKIANTGDMVAAEKRITDFESRKKIYNEMERIVIEDAAWIYLYYNQKIYLLQKGVNGFMLDGW